MRTWLGGMLFCSLLCLLMCSVSGTDEYQESDMNRILATRKAPLQFWVFQGYTDDDALKCVPLAGERDPVRIEPDSVEKTDFFAGSGDFDLLHGVICLLPYRERELRRWSIVSRLARVRERMPAAVPALDKRLRKLDAVLQIWRQDVPDRLRDRMLSLSSEHASALETQLQEGQFLLAVSMHMEWCRVIRQYPGISADDRAGLTRNAEKMLLRKADNLYRNQLYKKGFVKLFPRARGLWSGEPPQDWKSLQLAWRQSVQSCYDLRKYSSAADFEAWGNCMLNVLLFAAEMPQAKPLIRQYEQATAEYRKNFVR